MVVGSGVPRHGPARRSSRLVASAVVGALLLIGCSGGVDGNEEPREPSEDVERATGTGTSAAAYDPCGGPDHPCTYAEVSDEVHTRTDELAALAAAAMGPDGEDLEAAETELLDHEDVADVALSDEAVRFRVRGGRGMWVFGSGAGSMEPSLSMVSERPPPRIQRDTDHPGGAQLTPVDTTSGAGTGTGKKALLLSPFEWEWQIKEFDGGVDVVAQTLQEVRDYLPEHGGRVDVRVDTLGVERRDGVEEPFIDGQTSLASWTTWDDYDYVYVLTHGGFVCEGGGSSPSAAGAQCVTALVTSFSLEQGRAVAAVGSVEGATDYARDLSALWQTPGLEGSWISFKDVPAGTRLPDGRGLEVDFRTGPAINDLPGAEPSAYNAVGPFFTLTTPFFEAAYPSGVSDAVVFLNACSAGRQDDLVRALSGRNSAVTGWDRIMLLTSARTAGTVFTKALVGPSDTSTTDDLVGGLRVESALAAVRAAVTDGTLMTSLAGRPTVTLSADGGDVSDVVTGATLDVDGDRDVRAREITYLLDAADEELGPANAITVEGQADDGEDDELVINARIDGIDVDVDPASFALSVDVDGTEHALDSSALQRVRDGVWQLEETVPLGRDHSAGDLVDLEIVALLPEGGRSRWRYEQIPLGVGCGFQLAYAGSGTRPPEFAGAFDGVAAYSTDETGGGPTGLTSGAITVRVLPGDPPLIGPLLLSDQDPLTTILQVGYGPESPGIPLGETGTFRLPVEASISPEGVAGWQPVGELEFTITTNEPEVDENGDLRLGVVRGTFRSVGALTYTSPFPEDGVGADVTITDGTVSIDRAACSPSLL